jgi:putative glutamine amidotransferase
MTPIVFPNGQRPAAAERLVSLVDGVLLSGGDDVHPDTYRASTVSIHGSDAEVDQFEIAVIEAARSQDKPLLAICRGLQMLNVSMGGTLKQEVTSAGGVHELIDENTRPDDINNRRHVVRFEQSSVMASLYGADEAKVNTLHHQGIDRIAEGLIVEGRTDDGLVEAARCQGDWWALGVQWHPERMEGDHQLIFEAFREAIEAS